VSLPVCVTHRASGIRLTLIPAGVFAMGSPRDEGKDDEHPRHEVVIQRPFWLGTHPVTVGEWRRFVAARGAAHASTDESGVTGHETDGIVEWRTDPAATWRDPLPFLGFRPTDDHPVTMVNWFEARDFCARDGFRLPTEAEFEWALRGGTASRYWWGDAPGDAGGSGNYADRAMRLRFRHWKVGGQLLELPAFAHDDGFVFTSPVCTFAPNPFGLHDIGGNAWEWCEDVYDACAYAQGERDGHAPFRGPGDARVVRGASWDNGPRGARSASRYFAGAAQRLVNVGFRVARDG